MLVAAAGLALSATPGPSMLYVLSRSVGQSRIAGLASALGLGLGGVVLAAGAAFGLAALVKESALALSILKVAGSLYLIYLGGSMIWEARERETEDFSVREVRERTFAQIVWQGVLVEVLNPKTLLFFILFIPPFVNAQEGDVVTQMLILGILVPLTAVPSDIIVALIGGSVAEGVRSNPGIRKWLSWLGGGVLILIALNLHFEFI